MKQPLNYIIIFSVLSLFSCNHPHSLFENGLADWEITGNAEWDFTNEILTGSATDGEGYLIYNTQIENFTIEMEFNPESTINSGVFIRCQSKKLNPFNCYEINIWDLHPDQGARTGAIVSHTTPLSKIETIDQWNTYRIESKGNKISVWLNDKLVSELEDDTLKKGYLGLQAKGNGQVRFRNINVWEKDNL